MPQYPKVELRSCTLHSCVHPRFKFILWLAIQNRLATVDRLMKFGIQVPPDCAFCGATLETFDHLYFECLSTRALWRRLCHWMGMYRSIQDWKAELEWVCMLAKRKTGIAEIIVSVFSMLVYSIWRERNKIRFQKGKLDAEGVLKEVALHIHIRSQTKKKWQQALQQFARNP
ncbi:hypothetical protein R3W88_006440 [Solanum pinnatisectum]|uniref:Reverse transcriptase zinc-binding domain-containing protein n=1 Tax=Solanum pinnatisectum TaxID=50273 RepID=A0AAV9KIP3_9SOLN|nr:hypothetical protein R3W88_006440 [Solanum pinnatisectum]